MTDARYSPDINNQEEKLKEDFNIEALCDYVKDVVAEAITPIEERLNTLEKAIETLKKP
jgi:tetrahydromethanopterin S-methyltransferase subunit B